MWLYKRRGFSPQAAIYLERNFAAAWEFNISHLTANSYCNVRLDIPAENKYIVTEYFADTLSTCQIC